MKKKKLYRGAILVEVALTTIVNVLLLFGGLEFGWYLYSRQALVGAAREAVRIDMQRVAEQTVRNYLVGLDFSDVFINSVVVSLNQLNLNNPGPTKVNKVTVTIPLTQVLLFGGEFSRLYSTSSETTLSVTAYERENNLKKNN